MVDAAFPATLWNPFYAKTGIRPEWIVPVLASESGLNPSIVNSIGCIGINQACPWAVPTPPGYGSYTASQQLAGVVLGMYEAIIAKYGPLRSGVRVYQANFLPASLSKATALDSVLARRPSGGCPGGAANSQYVYCANSGFDTDHTGVITVGDLGLGRRPPGGPRVRQERHRRGLCGRAPRRWPADRSRLRTGLPRRRLTDLKLRGPHRARTPRPRRHRRARSLQQRSVRSQKVVPLMFGNLVRMVRFGPALLVVCPLACGGAPFTSYNPLADASDAVTAVDAGASPESASPESASTVDAASDGPKLPASCLSDAGSFACGQGAVSDGLVCVLKPDGGTDTVPSPLLCGCTPSCTCALEFIAPCVTMHGSYPISCTVSDAGHMTVTCSMGY